MRSQIYAAAEITFRERAPDNLGWEHSPQEGSGRGVTDIILCIHVTATPIYFVLSWFYSDVQERCYFSSLRTKEAVLCAYRYQVKKATSQSIKKVVVEYLNSFLSSSSFCNSPCKWKESSSHLFRLVRACRQKNVQTKQVSRIILRNPQCFIYLFSH